jgi:cytochrome c5
MRNILKQLALMASIGSTTLVLAQAPPPSKPAYSSGKSAPKAAKTNQPDVGQRKFNANCGRCHSSPEQLSPSLTGTVVRHMRVRASLSAEDEKDILRFLAP